MNKRNWFQKQKTKRTLTQIISVFSTESELEHLGLSVSLPVHRKKKSRSITTKCAVHHNICIYDLEWHHRSWHQLQQILHYAKTNVMFWAVQPISQLKINNYLTILYYMVRGRSLWENGKICYRGNLSDHYILTLELQYISFAVALCCPRNYTCSSLQC